MFGYDLPGNTIYSPYDCNGENDTNLDYTKYLLGVYVKPTLLGVQRRSKLRMHGQ